MRNRVYDRREILQWAGGALLGGMLSGRDARSSGERSSGSAAVPAASRSSLGGQFVPADDQPAGRKGCIVGQIQAAQVGEEVLAAGGNAVDAAVAAALTAATISIADCGIGGYGGHMVIALAGGQKVTAIDFNTTAPQAAREDMFPLDDQGNVKGQVNMFGWRAAGVPGTLAGLQLALDRYGTQPFAKLVQPAIRYAREGFEVSAGLANAIRAAQAQFRQDPGSARLFLNKGEPLKPGSTFRNPDLADLLQSLAERKSVEPFYRGDIARRIAAAFRKHGGLVTEKDLAAYQAREVEPLEFSWRGIQVRTAPLTAGGATVLEALAILKALGWEAFPTHDPKALHARLEALRIAWDDRLRLLGDPDQVKVPLERLLSETYAKDMAARVEAALRDGKPVPTETDGRKADGTIHLSAADAQGNLVALTLTHGGSFGARVTVEGLGLVLGHGMSRFDPRPGRPNSPGPGKRPLHNMCPTVLLRDGKPVLAVGARGGRRIPNAIFEVLAQYLGRGASLKEAVAALRLHTEGGRNVMLEPKAPKADAEFLQKLGYTVTTGASAVVSAVSFDPASGTCHTAAR
ncbi:MAG TPA: gamma-glutamyltransferase [Gemmataceae bacterium]|nr:gamma-glutamyltransferase [Gemmataceae bacterium]